MITGYSNSTVYASAVNKADASGEIPSELMLRNGNVEFGVDDDHLGGSPNSI